MDIKTIKVGAERTNCYLVSDTAGNAFVVDPGSEFQVIEQELKKIKNLKLKYILLTHGHYDHVQAVDDLKYAYPQTRVLIGGGDAEYIRKMAEQGAFVGKILKNIKTAVAAVSEGTILPFGTDNIKVFSTPGHTPGGLCYLVNNCLFSGDTLFWHTIGRTDLPLASGEDLMVSITKLTELPGETIVYPGHGRGTSIGEEIQHNPFLANTKP